jgi:colicin import membrane protein
MDGGNKFSAGLLAIIVHVLFFALLFVGVTWQSKRPQPVTVELWNTLPPPPPKPEVKPPPPAPKVEPKPEPKPEPEAEVKPKIDPEILLKEKEEKRKLEEQKRLDEVKKKEIERRKLEEEKKLKAEEERKRLEEEKRAKAEEEKRLKTEEEKRKLEAEQKRLAEEKKLAEEKRIADQQLAAMREAEAQRETAQQSARDKLKAEYIAQIGSKIKRNYLGPEIQGNPRVRLKVALLPSGEILGVTVVDPSGNPVYDAAVERAIYKSQPLPRPEDPILFQEFRELNLGISLQELRN